MNRVRALRKEDLLLASRLARGEALAALTDLGDRADAIAGRVERVRLWLSSPWVWASGGAGALVLGIVLRRVRASSLLRWGWLAWRLWRSAAPAQPAPVRHRTSSGRSQPA